MEDAASSCADTSSRHGSCLCIRLVQKASVYWQMWRECVRLWKEHVRLREKLVRVEVAMHHAASSCANTSSRHGSCIGQQHACLWREPVRL